MLIIFKFGLWFEQYPHCNCRMPKRETSRGGVGVFRMEQSIKWLGSRPHIDVKACGRDNNA